MPRSTMKVALIRHTLSPEEVVALGARLCYSRATVDSLQQRVSRDDQSEFVSRILSMGHESVLEHASFTFAMEGVSAQARGVFPPSASMGSSAMPSPRITMYFITSLLLYSVHVVETNVYYFYDTIDPLRIQYEIMPENVRKF